MRWIKNSLSNLSLLGTLKHSSVQHMLIIWVIEGLNANRGGIHWRSRTRWTSRELPGSRRPRWGLNSSNSRCRFRRCRGLAILKFRSQWILHCRVSKFVKFQNISWGSNRILIVAAGIAIPSPKIHPEGWTTVCIMPSWRRAWLQPRVKTSPKIPR